MSEHTPMPFPTLQHIGELLADAVAFRDAPHGDGEYAAWWDDKPHQVLAEAAYKIEWSAELLSKSLDSHAALRAALEEARSVLADLTEGKPTDNIVTLYARARGAEIRARRALTEA